MTSSRRTRRRRQQASFRRHQLRLEGLEKRYALNAAPVLDPSASPQLDSVIEDAGVPVGQVGTLVSSLIDSGAPDNALEFRHRCFPGPQLAIFHLGMRRVGSHGMMGSKALCSE